MTDKEQKSNDAAQQGEHVLMMTRMFDAPRELVWRAWTQPEHVAKWWGPRGFSTRVEELDLRTGGAWRYVMIGPDGNEYPSQGVFREVSPPNRIVSTDEFGEDFTPPADMELPSGIVMTVLFDEVDGGTRVTLHIAHATAEDRRRHEEMGVVPGWNSSLDCLAEYLASIA